MWTLVGGLAVLGAARRYYRNWGATKDESRMTLAGDDLVALPTARSTDAVSIDQSASTVWTQLVRMLQDPADPPGAQRFAVGNVIRIAPRGWLGPRKAVALTVAEIVPGRAIVLLATPPNLPRTRAWTFQLLPRGADQCRLLVRTHVALRHPGEYLATEAAGPFVALMIRTTLLKIRRRAEHAAPDPRECEVIPATCRNGKALNGMSRRA
jgi:hypothetical protein